MPSRPSDCARPAQSAHEMPQFLTHLQRSIRLDYSGVRPETLNWQRWFCRCLNAATTELCFRPCRAASQIPRPAQVVRFETTRRRLRHGAQPHRQPVLAGARRQHARITSRTTATTAVGSTGPTPASCCRWAASFRTPRRPPLTIDSTRPVATFDPVARRAGRRESRPVEHGRHGVAGAARRRHGRHESGRRHQQLLRQSHEQHVSRRRLHGFRRHSGHDRRSTRSWR